MNRRKISEGAIAVLAALDHAKSALGLSHDEMLRAMAAAARTKPRRLALAETVARDSMSATKDEQGPSKPP